jgi:hypothetical protein
VVGRVVDGVHTDGVQAKLLELGNVTLARLDIGNGVLIGRGSTGLVVDTTNVETLSAGEKGWGRSATKHVNKTLRNGPFPLMETTGKDETRGASGAAGVAAAPAARTARAMAEVFMVRRLR